MDLIGLIESEKGAIDVETWVDGTVARLIGETGQKVNVGQTIAAFALPGEDWQSVLAAAAALAAGSASKHEASASASSSSAAAKVSGPQAARDQVATASPGDQTKAATPTPKTDRLSGMRSVIAAAMTRSKREIPHYYVGTEISVGQALAWLQVFNASRPVTERILFIALQLKAIALALREVPQLNGSMIDGNFRQADSINIGVVTSLRGGGVLVPALHQLGADAQL